MIDRIRDTALAIPAILALKLQNSGVDVDFYFLGIAAMPVNTTCRNSLIGWTAFVRQSKYKKTQTDSISVCLRINKKQSVSDLGLTVFVLLVKVHTANLEPLPVDV